MNLSDIITQFIARELKNEGVCEIGRNQLAYKFNCSPSQINYVISTRFNLDQGYIVKSRRGGGGYIRITRLDLDKRDKVLRIVNSIQDQIDLNKANIIISDLLNNSFISKKEANIISFAICEDTLKNVNQGAKSQIRADIFKNILISLI